MLVNVGLAFFSAGLALAAVEWVLRTGPLALQVRPYRLRLQDPNLWDEPYLQVADDIPYTTRPDYVGRWASGGRITINHQGFRTDAAGAARSYARIDILCLGDSFTFGYLVDDADTYPGRLGRLYESSGQTVVNAGYYGGFSFDSAGLRYRRTLAPWHPRVVIYGVFPGNDLDDLAVWTRTSPGGGPAQLRTKNQIVDAAGYSVPLARESRLFVGLSQAWSRWRLRDELAETDERRWARASDAIHRLRETTDRAGTRLVFVFLREPNGQFAQEIARRRQVPAADFLAGLEAQTRRLQDVLDAEHVEWHDDESVLAALRAALGRRHLPPLPGSLSSLRADLEARAEAGGWQPRLLAGPDEIHYSPLTNAYVASWVYAQLQHSP